MSDNDIRALTTHAFARFNEDEGCAAFFDAYDADSGPARLPRLPAGARRPARVPRSAVGSLSRRPPAVEDLVVEGDRAALRYRLQGTHRGPYLGVPPTGLAAALRLEERQAESP